jgi:hypothetical protein
VSEYDGLGFWEACGESFDASFGWPRIVRDRDAVPVEFELLCRGQQSSELGLVDVSMDCMELSTDGVDFLQDAQGGDIACMDDGVGFAHERNAATGQFTAPARQMRVRDNRDQHRAILAERRRGRLRIEGAGLHRCGV